MGENQVNKKDFPKNWENQGNFKFFIVSAQSGDFLHSQSLIHFSLGITQFYHFVYHSVVCSHFEAPFHFVLKHNFEWLEKASRLSKTPYLSKEMMK